MLQYFKSFFVSSVPQQIPLDQPHPCNVKLPLSTYIGLSDTSDHDSNCETLYDDSPLALNLSCDYKYTENVHDSLDELFKYLQGQLEDEDDGNPPYYDPVFDTPSFLAPQITSLPAKSTVPVSVSDTDVKFVERDKITLSTQNITGELTAIMKVLHQQNKDIKPLLRIQYSLLKYYIKTYQDLV